MAHTEFFEPPQSCEPFLRSLSKLSPFFVGRDSRGDWVVCDQAGLTLGLFVNRSEALRFAMLENGRRPRAVVMVSEILESSIPCLSAAASNHTAGRRHS
jgi:hypothetical protein